MKTSPEKPWYISALTSFLMVDVPQLLGVSPSALSRDIHTLDKRLSCEGESFLTKTLPSFIKDVDKALQGDVPLTTAHFKKISSRDARPAFLQTLLKRIFLDTGWVTVSPCTVSIRLVRQIGLWCKKIEKGYSDETLRQAVEDFIQVDDCLPSADTLSVSACLVDARAVVQYILGDLPSITTFRPKHGPGAVAGGEDLFEKRELKHSYQQLERVFRPIPFFYSLTEAARAPWKVTDRFTCEYGLSRTTFVEKDSSGPRTIGLEPAEYQWCQQAVKTAMYDFIENHSPVAGYVNFTDQAINRSLTNNWVEYDTLDMSKASDRNSYALVEYLFSGLRLWNYLAACRTPGTILPDGRIVMFKKFAPMGSAVCFPVQAVVYYALAVASLHRQGMPVQIAMHNVYVYGDDLIVPHGFFHGIREDFERVCLKFNDSKCCVAGKFRESCGRDAYDGVEITPVRLRKPHCKDDSFGFMSMVKHVNNMRLHGYRATADVLKDLVEKKYKRTLPTSPRTDLPILYWVDPDSEETVKYRYKEGLCLVRGLAFSPKKRRRPAVDETKYLQESLCLGGPVGTLIVNKVTRKPEFRVLTEKYRGSLKVKTFIVSQKEQLVKTRLLLRSTPMRRPIVKDESYQRARTRYGAWEQHVDTDW